MIYLTAVLLILLMLAGWLLVQDAARRFAQRHPEFDASHEEGCGGCMNNCGAKRQGHRSQG